MSRSCRRRLVFGLIAAGAVLLLLGQVAWVGVAIGAGYQAKILCSGLFVSGLDQETIEEQDLAPTSILERILLRGRFSVDVENRAVEVTAWGIRRVARLRPDLGSYLEFEDAPTPSIHLPLTRSRPSADRSRLPWPRGDADLTEADRVDAREAFDLQALRRAVDSMFEKSDPPCTRALLITHEGRLIHERYAPGIDPSTPLPGWSISKSVIALLLGILVRQEGVDLKEAPVLEEWSDEEDPRRAIHLDHLLRMSSGLKFGESYADPRSDTLRMLFGSPSAAAVALKSPPRHPPDEVWQYSSGTTNLLCLFLRRRLKEKDRYLTFPREELFEPIGADSAILEVDQSGGFVGSSFMYASARDFARLGQLCLDDGTWQGNRLLPEGWMRYCTTPTKGAPRGEYGAHFWLNAGNPGDPADRYFRTLPDDVFFMSGYRGQYVLMLPTERLVLVRLGTSANGLDIEAFVRSVLDSLAKSKK